MNLTTELDDSWSTGSFDKSALWTFYVSTNIIGSILNALLLIAIAGQWRRVTAADVFAGVLSSGCLLMSLPCAIQCLLDLAHGRNRFEYGDTACYLEAFFHVSAIIVQFLGIQFDAVTGYLKLMWDKTLSKRHALAAGGMIWITAEVGTATIGMISDHILMPAGAYCFYAFDSPVILYWFSPIMLTALTSVGAIYVRIFLHIRQYQVARKMARQVITSICDYNLPFIYFLLFSRRCIFSIS